MTDTLKKLLAFIKEVEPEIHYQEHGEKEIVIFLYIFWIENFMKIFEDLTDESFDFVFRNDSFVFVLNDFIENHCEISLEDFTTITK